MSDFIRDAIPEAIGGVVAFLVLGALSLLWRSVRLRLREVLYRPRITVHVWQEVVIDGQKRRLIPWPSLVVGLGKDPIHRGNLEPRVAAKTKYLKSPWVELRDMLIPPLYPLGENVSKADSLVAVHFVVRNTGNERLTPSEVGQMSLRLDVPSLHVLDWSRGVFDEPGWGRSLDPNLEGPDWSTKTWWEYEHRREIPDDRPTTLQVGLKRAIGDKPSRDVLGVLTTSQPSTPTGVSVSLRPNGHQIPLLFKPWRPALPGERLRHPFRTAWRRLVVASRIRAHVGPQ